MDRLTHARRLRIVRQAIPIAARLAVLDFGWPGSSLVHYRKPNHKPLPSYRPSSLFLCIFSLLLSLRFDCSLHENLTRLKNVEPLPYLLPWKCQPMVHSPYFRILCVLSAVQLHYWLDQPRPPFALTRFEVLFTGTPSPFSSVSKLSGQ